MNNNEYLNAAAAMVAKQAAENPDIGIPVDPGVADFMGAFVDDDISFADVLDALAEWEE